MAKRSAPFETDALTNDSDTLDELEDEVEIKSPKKAKKETQMRGSTSPNSKAKAARASTAKNSWTKEEEEALMDCLQNIITTYMAQAMKEFPCLAARKSDGCIKHWNAIRRKHETAILGAPTINNNGKKIAVADRVRVNPTQTE